jgi:Spy/CpxP family protein refolding chaperone
MLAEALGLSDEQTAKVKELFEGRSDPASTQKAMEEILTPEQKTKYEEWKSQRGPMRGDRRGPRGMRMRSPEKHAAWLQEELGLTDEVTAKVAGVFAEPMGPEATHEALKEILGDEEYAQFEEMIADQGRWGGKRGPKAGFHAPKKHAAWLQAELGLTDEQASKVETALSESKSREEMQKALEGILTPEQLAQHDQLMSERHHHFGRGMRGKPGMHGRPGMRDGKPGMGGGKRGMRGKADMGAQSDAE